MLDCKTPILGLTRIGRAVGELTAAGVSSEHVSIIQEIVVSTVEGLLESFSSLDNETWPVVTEEPDWVKDQNDENARAWQ